MRADFPYPPGGPRYERLVFDANDQLIVPLNEWYRLMKGIGAARTRDTYLAVLRPWFGFLAKHGYQWNARPEAVREYTRLFLLEAGCALRTGRVEGWFVQATNRSPISANGLHLLIAALRSFYTVMARGVFDPAGPALPPAVRVRQPDVLKGPGRLAVGASQVDPQRWSAGLRWHPFGITRRLGPPAGRFLPGAECNRLSRRWHATRSRRAWRSWPGCAT